MNTNDSSGTPDSRLENALEEFRKAWFSADPLEPDEILKRHPELLPELKNEIEGFLLAVTEFPLTERIRRFDETEDIVGDSSESLKIIGDFKILRELGSGGMGTVYEADQLSLKRKVALKLLPAHLSFSDLAVAKFQREAEAGGRQSHPGIVTVYAVGEHQGRHYIAQELVGNGVTLADKIEKFRQDNKQPAGYFRSVAELIMNVAEALQHAHETGVTHRDIKPSNILIADDGNPKVTDFGLAKIEKALALSRTGELAGTPHYMSPEQAASRKSCVDHRSDIYSLGVTLYEMLTLKLPFDGETSIEVLRKIIALDPVDPQKANRRVPKDLNTICLKAMDKSPEHRYPSMEDFAADLRRFLSGDVISARSVSVGRRLWRRASRNPVVSISVSVAALSVVILATVLPWILVAEAKKREDQAKRDRIEIQKKHKEAETARAKAEDLAKISNERYEKILQLSDVQRLTDLKKAETKLWPAHPRKIKELEKWIDDAEKLISRFDVPIGRDPGSRLWEFAHLLSGEIPERGTNGKLELTDKTGVVLVLIPGGVFNMGAVRPTNDAARLLPNSDPWAENNEKPVRSVTMSPFFLSKYELTQGQWFRFTGRNPSIGSPEESNPAWNRKKVPVSLLHPVENVNWLDCRNVLFKLNLRLPSEAEWEYSCRAETTSVWWTGNDIESLADAINLADLFCKNNGGHQSWPYEEYLDDGYTAHSPVGRFRPNAYGLHDMSGNVFEWCQDVYCNYKDAPSDGSPFDIEGEIRRLYRGGAWNCPAETCRSACRFGNNSGFCSNDLGVRPAFSLP